MLVQEPCQLGPPRRVRRPGAGGREAAGRGLWDLYPVGYRVYPSRPYRRERATRRKRRHEKWFIFDSRVVEVRIVYTDDISQSFLHIYRAIQKEICTDFEPLTKHL